MASASFTGIDQSPVKITCVVTFGLASLAPKRERVDVAQHLRNGLGGDEAELAGLRHIAGDDAADMLRLVDIAEIAAGVFRILVRPQAAAMLEAQLRILRRLLEHVRIVVAERGREEQRRAVEIDHRFHGLLHGVGLGDFLFLDHLDAGHLLERGGAGGVRLVVAIVVARADIDEADGGVGGHCRAQRQGGTEGHGRRSLQDAAA